MKFMIMLKDPDGFDDGIGDAAEASLPQGLSRDERQAVMDMRTEEIAEALKRWVSDGECISVEFDTEAGTATVKERE